MLISDWVVNSWRNIINLQVKLMFSFLRNKKELLASLKVENYWIKPFLRRKMKYCAFALCIFFLAFAYQVNLKSMFFILKKNLHFIYSVRPLGLQQVTTMVTITKEDSWISPRINVNVSSVKSRPTLLSTRNWASARPPPSLLTASRLSLNCHPALNKKILSFLCHEKASK